MESKRDDSMSATVGSVLGSRNILAICSYILMRHNIWRKSRTVSSMSACCCFMKLACYLMSASTSANICASERPFNSLMTDAHSRNWLWSRGAVIFTTYFEQISSIYPTRLSVSSHARNLSLQVSKWGWICPFNSQKCRKSRPQSWLTVVQSWSLAIVIWKRDIVSERS